VYLCIPALAVIGIVVVVAAESRWMWRKAPGLGKDISMAITESGMSFIHEGGETMRTWDLYKVVTESRHSYFAQPSRKRGFVPLFPKRAFDSPEEERSFRALADAHTKSRLGNH